MKKFFAWLLVCLMIVTSIPMAAFAEGGSQDRAMEITKCPGDKKPEDHNAVTAVNKSYIETVAPTCNAYGYDLYQCDDCKVYFAINFVDPIGHVAGKLLVPGTAATCTTGGVTPTYECKFCGQTFGGTPTAALGHDLKEVEKFGSCTVKGWINYECQREGCDYTETKDYGGEGHKWVYVSTADEPGNATNCETDGIANVKCTVCGTTKQVAIDSETDNVKHQLVLVPQLDPTCTTAGYKAYYQCKNCAQSFYDAEGTKTRVTYLIAAQDPLYIPALGHYGDVTKVPTCTEEGMLHCERCGLDVTLDPTGHGNVFDEATVTTKPGVKGVDWDEAYLAPTCLNDGSYNKRCLKCGYMMEDIKYDALGHATWGSDRASVSNAPVYPDGCLEPGTRTWICGGSVDHYGVKHECGVELSEAVPATGHTVVEVKNEGTCVINKYTFTYCSNPHCIVDAVSTFKAEDEKEYDVTVNGAAVKLLSFELLTDADGNYIKGNHGLDDSTAVVNPATCTQDGTKTGACIYCSFWYVEKLDKLGHEYNDPTVDNDTVVQLNDTQHIIRKYCDRNCGHYEDTNEDHNFDDVKVIAPTCVAQGYTLHTCTACGFSKKDTYTDFDFGTPNKELLKELDDYIPETTRMDWNLYKSRAAAVEAGHINLDLKATICLRHANYNGEEVVAGLHIYACKAPGCNRNVLVVDYPAERECTDTTYKCEGCDEIITIAGLGHDWEVVDYKPATCAAAGHTEYKKCKRCNVEDGTKKVLPQLTHNNTTLVDQNHTVKKGGAEDEYNTFDYYDCIWCEGEYAGYPEGEIKNYDNHDEKYYVLVPGDKPACEVGYELYVCPGCDARPNCTESYKVDVFHVNIAGEILENKCTDEPLDRHCVICDKDIAKDHDYKVVEKYNATCISPAYDLKVCKHCEHSVNSYVGEKDPNAHLESDWYVIKPASYLEKGLEGTKCLLCGKDPVQTKEIPALMFAISMDAHNVLTNATIVDSSLVAVDVYMSGNADIADSKIWGIELTVNYNAANLVFDSFTATGDGFLPELCVTAVHNGNGTVTFAVSTSEETDTGDLLDVVIGKDQKIATLYFRADAAVDAPFKDAVKTSLSFGDYEILNADKKNLYATFANEEISIENFADVDNDGAITLKDAQLIADLFLSQVDQTVADFDASADIDKDGYITFADFDLVYNYVVGNNVYNDLCLAGTEE